MAGLWTLSQRPQPSL